MTTWHYPADRRREKPFTVTCVICAGEARLKFAHEQYYDRPCVLTPNQVRALLPALKHFGDTGEWRNDLVQYGLSDERAAEWAREVLSREEGS